jgi:hypothetical protein
VIRALGPGPVMPAILGQLLGARYRAQEPAGAARAAAAVVDIHLALLPGDERRVEAGACVAAAEAACLRARAALT